MGIFGFFKKSRKIEVKESIKEVEIISRNKIFEWVLNKKKQHMEGEQNFLAPIKERISQLVSELESEIVILENIDFDSKKSDERVKFIVKENLNKYVEYLQKMIRKLREIEGREKIVKKINLVLGDFNRKSEINYQKVTFLVGKEMQATKTSMNSFLKDLEGILKNNSEEFEEFEIVLLLEKDVRKLKSVEEDKNRVLKIFNEDVEKMKSLEKDLEVKKSEIIEIKESEKFKQEKTKRKELELKKKKLERCIYTLRGLINFKLLSNFYHKFEKEMKLVKEYKNNFKQTFGENNLVDLLKGAKLDSPKILELIQKIENDKKEILKIVIEDFGVSDLKREIERIENEIKNIESEKLLGKKRLEILKEELNLIIELVKDKLKKIKVEIE